MVGLAVGEATGKPQTEKRSKKDVSNQQVVVLGSGNLGLVSLMEESRRLTLEEIDERHPRLIPSLRAHPHVGWLLVRSRKRGPVALGSSGARSLAEGTIEGEDPLAPFSPNAPHHLLRTDGFPHVAGIMVGSFYEPDLEEGCAFEELISFHGGWVGRRRDRSSFIPSDFRSPTTRSWERSTFTVCCPAGGVRSKAAKAPMNSPPDEATSGRFGSSAWAA